MELDGGYLDEERAGRRLTGEHLKGKITVAMLTKYEETHVL